MIVKKTSVPITKIEWSAIDWQTVELKVNQLQFRIAKAIRAGRYNKVKALQYYLSMSATNDEFVQIRRQELEALINNSLMAA